VELRVYALIVLAFSSMLAVFLMTHHSQNMDYAWGDAIRHASFNVTSILTTTGYASADFALWVPAAQAILVAAMFVGGCAGSGAGGIKVVRLLVVGAIVWRELIPFHVDSFIPGHQWKRVCLRTVAGSAEST